MKSRMATGIASIAGFLGLTLWFILTGVGLMRNRNIS